MNKKLNELLLNTYIIYDKYYARLEKKERFIFLNIEFALNEEFVEFDKDKYDILIAKEVTSDKIYTFIECDNYGYSCTNNKIIIKYRVDKVYDGKLEKLDEKKF